MPPLFRPRTYPPTPSPCLGIAAWLLLCLALMLVGPLANRPAQAEAPSASVVSLCPEATKLIIHLGAAQKLAGVSQMSQGLPGLPNGVRVLGWWAPSVREVKALKPKLVILDPHQQKLAATLRAQIPHVIVFQADGLSKLPELISRVGDLVAAQPRLVKQIKDELQHETEILKRKSALIGNDRQRRVAVVLGLAPAGKALLLAGPGSWAHSLLAAGGAIAVPQQGDALQTVSLQAWKALDPQAVAVASDLRSLAAPLLSSPGWNAVEAAQIKRVRYFPRRALTTPSMRSAIAAQWLATAVYSDFLGAKQTLLHPNAMEDSRSIKIALPYVAGVFLTHERIGDFRHSTIQVRLKEPGRVLSTLEGQVEGISTVANHHLPPPYWNLGHGGGLAGLKKRICRVLELEPANSSLLYTGVPMENLVIKRTAEKGLEVFALVTAGAMSNAMRLGRDQGRYVEPGTINIIILTNRRLSPRAMARALVTVTEAKTGALQDLDIRSTYTPIPWSATGTGTDNVLVVEGRGAPANVTGGHSKLGELIARAVRLGVTEAIGRQNGLTVGRGIFSRLRERGLGVGDIYRAALHKGVPAPQALAAGMERRLLRPEISSAMQAALAIADAQSRGLAASSIKQPRVKAIISAEPPAWLAQGSALPRSLALALGGLLSNLPGAAQ